MLEAFGTVAVLNRKPRRFDTCAECNTCASRLVFASNLSCCPFRTLASATQSITSRSLAGQMDGYPRGDRPQTLGPLQRWPWRKLGNMEEFHVSTAAVIDA